MFIQPRNPSFSNLNSPSKLEICVPRKGNVYVSDRKFSDDVSRMCKSLTKSTSKRPQEQFSSPLKYPYTERKNDCSFHFQHSASLHSLSNPLNTHSPAPATTMHFPTMSTLPPYQLSHYPYPDSPQSTKTPI